MIDFLKLWAKIAVITLIIIAGVLIVLGTIFWLIHHNPPVIFLFILFLVVTVLITLAVWDDPHQRLKRERNRRGSK